MKEIMDKSAYLFKMICPR